MNEMTSMTSTAPDTGSIAMAWVILLGAGLLEIVMGHRAQAVGWVFPVVSECHRNQRLSCQLLHAGLRPEGPPFGNGLRSVDGNRRRRGRDRGAYRLRRQPVAGSAGPNLSDNRRCGRTENHRELTTSPAWVPS